MEEGATGAAVLNATSTILGAFAAGWLGMVCARQLVRILLGTPMQPCTLRERLADLEAQKDVALSTDVASPD
jgi:hypothetical protein